MIPAKEEVRRIINGLPEDSTFEDIQYHIYIRQKMDRGIKDIEAEHTISEDKFDARMSKWLEASSRIII